MKIDSFIATCASFDVGGGDLDLVIELEGKDGKLDGYFKPLRQNLEVLHWHEDILMTIMIATNRPTFHLKWYCLVEGWLASACRELYLSGSL